MQKFFYDAYIACLLYYTKMHCCITIIQPYLNLYMIFLQVHSTGVFELYLGSFQNRNGHDSDGNCCNGIFSPSSSLNCSSSCRTFFRICLTHYQTHITDEVHCSYAEEITPVLGDNNVNFHNLPVKFENPVRFPFQFSWPVSFCIP